MRDLPPVLARRGHGERVEIDLDVGVDCPWFEGHFDGHPILPGVVQVGWAAHFAEEVCGFSAPPVTLERIKFKRPVRPGMQLTLELNLLPGKVRYEFHDAEHCVSSGVMCFKGA